MSTVMQFLPGFDGAPAVAAVAGALLSSVDKCSLEIHVAASG